MMSNDSSPAHPPRIAAWLVELFASPREADGLLGDLAEEFSAAAGREGEAEARRRYRRHAWRSVRDLAVSQWRSRPWSTLALAMPGLLLMLPFGPGLVLSAPTRSIAGVIVTHYPVYHYVPAAMFWQIVLAFPSLITGVLVASVAGILGMRPMSSALAVVTALAFLNTIAAPILLFLYGQPDPPITFAHWAVNLAGGLMTFGAAALLGGVIGRAVMPRPSEAAAAE
jgi:hypothetical protein